MEIRKKPEVNLDKMRYLYIAMGFVISLSLVLSAFEYRTFEEKITELFNEIMEEEVEETVIATMTAPPPPPPPPPPSVVEVMEIVEDDEIIEEEVDFNQDVNENTEVNTNDFTGETTEEVSDDNEVFTVVEDYPRFAGCENEKTEQEALDCFNKKLAAFLQKNVNYPPQAKDLGVQGKVFVEFVIEKDGNVTNVKVLRGIGSGCDEEAIRVVKLLPKFTPARQRGRPVRMIYRLPIQFRLS